MTEVRFDDTHKQDRVILPRLKKLPPNPHIAGHIRLAPSSEASSVNSSQVSRFETKADKSLRYDLLTADQRCFLTGSASASLRACHIIITVRKDGPRKIKVERLLTAQGFSGANWYLQEVWFDLNSTANAILLEPTFHVHWDSYGTFCIVPALDDARRILTALKENNQEWEDRCKHARAAIARHLNIFEPPFAKPSWDVVVLHPYALLPESQPLAILQNRTLVESGQARPPESPPNWTFWTAQGDRLCSASPPHDAFPPFVTTNTRGDWDCLEISSLAMIVNAHSKLQQYMENYGSDASARVQEFAQLMDELVVEIFFVPPSIRNVKKKNTVFSQPDLACNIPSRRLRGARFHSEPNLAQDETIPEYPESPGEDGLTDSEFSIVADKAQDGQLDARERANAAMMMLFGTRRYEDPIVHTPSFHTMVDRQ